MFTYIPIQKYIHRYTYVSIVLYRIYVIMNSSALLFFIIYTFYIVT